MAHNKIALDLKHFKHVKSDDKTTTLQHKNGHMLTLAHKSLHPEAQAQLAALSKIASAAQTDEQSDEMKHKMSVGGEVRPNRKEKSEEVPKEKSPKDTAIEHQQHIVNQHESDKGYFHKDTRKELKKVNKMKGYAEGGGVQQQNQQQDMIKTAMKLAPLLFAADGGKVPKFCAYCGGMAHGGECVDHEAPTMAGGREYFDDGGSVNRDNNKEGAKAVVKDAQEGGVSMSQGWENIKNAFSGKGPAYEAEGGPVAKPTGSPNSIPENDTTPYDQTMSNGWKNIKNAFSGKAEGGEVKQYAEGDVVSQDEPAIDPRNIATQSIDNALYNPVQAPPPKNPTDKARDIYNNLVQKQLGVSAAVNKLTPEEAASSAAPFQFKPGSNEAPQNFDSELWSQAMQQQQATENYSQMSAQKDAEKQRAKEVAMQQAGIVVPPSMSAVAPQVTPATPDVANAAEPQQPQEVARAAQDSGAGVTGDYQSMLMKGYQNQAAGLQAGARAQGALGQAEAGVLDHAAVANQAAQDNFQHAFNELNAERQNTIEDIRNNLINPEHYWEDHSKIAAGIGMILAGFNPTSNPNAAIGFINNQINRDMEAQAKNLQARDSLLSHNLQQFGNLRNAAEMTRLQMLDMVNHQLGTAAAKAKGPLAQAAAQQAQGQLQMQMAPLMMNLSVDKAIMNIQRQPNGGMPHGASPTAQAEAMLPFLDVRAPQKAAEIRARLIPGVGIASTPVPEAAKGQMVAYKDVNNLFNKSLEIAQTPIPKTPAEYAKYRAAANTVHQQLIGSIKQAQHDGVYKPSEAEFLLKQIGDSPASVFRAYSAVPKLKELQTIKQGEYNNLLSQYGLPQTQLPQAQAAPQYKTVNGVKYMRGPNGEAIPVK
jgi:hypothetical protein